MYRHANVTVQQPLVMRVLSQHTESISSNMSAAARALAEVGLCILEVCCAVADVRSTANPSREKHKRTKQGGCRHVQTRTGHPQLPNRGRIVTGRHPLQTRLSPPLTPTILRCNTGAWAEHHYHRHSRWDQEGLRLPSLPAAAQQAGFNPACCVAPAFAGLDWVMQGRALHRCSSISCCRRHAAP